MICLRQHDAYGIVKIRPCRWLRQHEHVLWLRSGDARMIVISRTEVLFTLQMVESALHDIDKMTKNT